MNLLDTQIQPSTVVTSHASSEKRSDLNGAQPSNSMLVNNPNESVLNGSNHLTTNGTQPESTNLPTNEVTDYSTFKKLFVTNIPGDINEDQFSQMLLPFQQNGGLRELKFFKRVVTDTCYAFLEFESGIDGKKCLDSLDGRDLYGNIIHVGPASRRNPHLSSTNIYVEGLPKQWRDMELRKFFEVYGAIHAARVLYDKYTNESREVGFVHFAEQDMARAAMEDWNGKKPFPTAAREFVIRFANKGKKERTMSNGQRMHRGDFHRTRKLRTDSRDYHSRAEMSPEDTSPKYSQFCKYYTRGNCKRGNACFYRHDNGDGYEYDQGSNYDGFYSPGPSDSHGYEYGYNAYDTAGYSAPPYSSSHSQAAQMMSYSPTESNMYGYAPHGAGQWGGGYSAQRSDATTSDAQSQWDNYYAQHTHLGHPTLNTTASANALAHSAVATSTATTTTPIPATTTNTSSSINSNSYAAQTDNYYALTAQTMPQTSILANIPLQGTLSSGYSGVRSTGGLTTGNTRYHPYQISGSSQTL